MSRRDMKNLLFPSSFDIPCSIFCGSSLPRPPLLKRKRILFNLSTCQPFNFLLLRAPSCLRGLSDKRLPLSNHPGSPLANSQSSKRVDPWWTVFHLKFCREPLCLSLSLCRRGSNFLTPNSFCVPSCLRGLSGKRLPLSNHPGSPLANSQSSKRVDPW
jgi:hypothetical protein